MKHNKCCYGFGMFIWAAWLTSELLKANTSDVTSDVRSTSVFIHQYPIGIYTIYYICRCNLYTYDHFCTKYIQHHPTVFAL